MHIARRPHSATEQQQKVCTFYRDAEKTPGDGDKNTRSRYKTRWKMGDVQKNMQFLFRFPHDTRKIHFYGRNKNDLLADCSIADCPWNNSTDGSEWSTANPSQNVIICKRSNRGRKVMVITVNAACTRFHLLHDGFCRKCTTMHIHRRNDGRKDKKCSGTNQRSWRVWTEEPLCHVSDEKFNDSTIAVERRLLLLENLIFPSAAAVCVGAASVCRRQLHIWRSRAVAADFQLGIKRVACFRRLPSPTWNYFPFLYCCLCRHYSPVRHRFQTVRRPTTAIYEAVILMTVWFCCRARKTFPGVGRHMRQATNATQHTTTTRKNENENEMQQRTERKQHNSLAVQIVPNRRNPCAVDRVVLKCFFSVERRSKKSKMCHGNYRVVATSLPSSDDSSAKTFLLCGYPRIRIAAKRNQK